MKVIWFAVAVFLFSITGSFSAGAQQSDFYGVLGVGSSRFTEKNHPYENRSYSLLEEGDIKLGFSAEDHGMSTVSQAGIGYKWSEHILFEVLYRRGFQASRSYKATLTYGDRQPTLVDAVYRVELDGFELSFVPKVPLGFVSEKLSLTGRLGAFRGIARANISSPVFPGGYSIETERRNQWLPVAGAGLRYQSSKRVFIGVEHIGVNKKYGLTLLATGLNF